MVVGTTEETQSGYGADRAALSRSNPLPSLLRYSPALVIVAIAIADAVRLADPDLWGHVRFGQTAIRNGHLVLRDTYSYSAAGHVFQDHEWLTNIVSATAYGTLGVFGLKLLKLICTAAAIFTVAMAEAETGAPEFGQFAILVAIAGLSAPQFQFRPQIFTFAMFGYVILTLTREAYGRHPRSWPLIPLFIAWANLHGGFIMGLAALGIFAAVAGVQDLIAGRGLGRAIKPATITVGCTIATLATPYGIGIWMAILHALANPYTRIAVADWQPLISAMMRQFHQGGAGAVMYILPIMMIAATAVACGIAPEATDLPMVAVAGVMAVAAFMSQRNITIALIALAPVLARHGWLASLRLTHAAETTAPAKAQAPAPVGNQVVLILVAVFLLAGTGFFSRELRTTAPYPAGAVAFMDSHGLHGNVLNNFLWGDYLIWHLAPESKVFIDGRYDTVYPEAVLLDFMLFHFDQHGGDAILTQYPHDFVMISPESQAVKIMSARKDWTLVYFDKSTLLYARAGSPAANIPGAPIKGANPPSTFP